MKKILCYGDSNTFGFNPENGLRFDEKNRWSGILKENLKESFEVLENGLNNRAGMAKSLDSIEYSPIFHISKLLEKIKPDILILAIGTNDFQFQYNLDNLIIGKELKKLIKFIKSKNIDIILIPPVILNEVILNSWFSALFNQESIEKSKSTIEIYKKIANDESCKFFDLNEFVKPSKIDGLHFENFSHQIIANKLTDFIIKSYF